MVPSEDPGAVLGEPEFMREKRDCKSPNWGPFELGPLSDALFSDFQGFDSSMPSVGTETPALLSLSIAPWFKPPFVDEDSWTAASYVGGATDRVEFDDSLRGGNRGGKEGFGFGVACEMPERCALVGSEMTWCVGGGGR